jgi:hypothetical protein
MTAEQRAHEAKLRELIAEDGYWTTEDVAACRAGADALARVAALETALAQARLDHECSEGVLSMTVARLGGIVEGNPTGRHNFLQRVDALRRMEGENTALREALETMLASALVNAKEHPYMAAAWNKARAALGVTQDTPGGRQ